MFADEQYELKINKQKPSSKQKLFIHTIQYLYKTIEKKMLKSNNSKVVLLRRSLHIVLSSINFFFKKKKRKIIQTQGCVP